MRKRRILAYGLLLILSLLFLGCRFEEGISWGFGKQVDSRVEQDQLPLGQSSQVGSLEPHGEEKSSGTDLSNLASQGKLPFSTIDARLAHAKMFKKAKLTVNGDHLIHDLIYMSAYDPETNSYDFKKIYEETRSLTKKADLAIGNFEGTMCPDLPLSGYPLFNAPPELAEALKYAGYDLMSFANNHMADSNGPGILSTVDLLEKQGIGVFGPKLPGRDFIVVKDINGIKFSFLAYSYGFNGMEGALTAEEQGLLSWLDPVTIEEDIKKARSLSDIVMVFPHMGIEYDLQPNQEQVDLFHKMIDWGADLVLGNHPHVIQPIEKYKDKFILYSMGNFISNQRVETGLDIWTERGVILEFDFEKEGSRPARMVSYQLHPTWVERKANGKYSPEGYSLYDFRVLLAENHLADDYIATAYHAVLDHMENGFE